MENRKCGASACDLINIITTVAATAGVDAGPGATDKDFWQRLCATYVVSNLVAGR